jgi:hypothetical protein
MRTGLWFLLSRIGLKGLDRCMIKNQNQNQNNAAIISKSSINPLPRIQISNSASASYSPALSLHSSVPQPEFPTPGLIPGESSGMCGTACFKMRNVSELANRLSACDVECLSERRYALKFRSVLQFFDDGRAMRRTSVTYG